MKNLFVILAMLVAMNVSGQWVQVSNGIMDPNVRSLAISGNNIIAGTEGGLYFSTNYGTNWSQVNLLEHSIYSIASNNNAVFAGTGNSGVFITTNNGINWTQTALNDRWILSLAASNNYIFAGTYNTGVYVTTNNGTNWSQTTLNNREILSLNISENTIYAGTNFGVYKSTDNGINWTFSNINNLGVYSLVIVGNNIFAGTNNGVYISTNNCVSWDQTALTNLNVESLAASGNNIFAGTIYGVYLSKNNGFSWTLKNEGLNHIILELSILGNYIFAGTFNWFIWRHSLSEIINVQNISAEIPASFSLGQNYPNPFNPTTKIKFSVANGFPVGTSGNDKIVLKVYDVMGREVQTLVNESLKPGTYEVSFDGSQLTSGVYFYKFITAGFTEAKKMLIIK